MKMMKAYVFPGQGAQFPGMAKDLYETSPKAREMFSRANEILGFDITEIMFGGTAEQLKQTKVTQPAIFLHSVILASCSPDFRPDMVAGHSLGEFSALTAAGALDFEDGLRLVAIRAGAMQKACEAAPGTMAAVLGLSAETVEEICSKCAECPEGAGTEAVVVPANYNCEGQIVISGSLEGVAAASARLKEAGARKVVQLPVGGAFHSPLMKSAADELAEGIKSVRFRKPVCPVYQNYTAQPTTDPDIIKTNLLSQLTGPVRWTQTIVNMIADGADEFIESGPGKVLQGLISKISRDKLIIRQL